MSSMILCPVTRFKNSLKSSDPVALEDLRLIAALVSLFTAWSHGKCSHQVVLDITLYGRDAGELCDKISVSTRCGNPDYERGDEYLEIEVRRDYGLTGGAWWTGESDRLFEICLNTRKKSTAEVSSVVTG